MWTLYLLETTDDKNDPRLESIESLDPSVWYLFPINDDILQINI